MAPCPPEDVPIRVLLDAPLPPEMAGKAEEVGVRKANADTLSTFVLAVLAGAFIALGAAFATTVAAGAAGQLPFGVTRLLAGLVFSLGLILVVVGGAELFTGNNLIVMAWASRKISTTLVLKNWAVVFAGNLVGAFATAALVYLGGQHRFGNGAVGLAALTTANAKTALGPVEAVALGALCNALVCLAVWLTYSARTTTDKILCVVPPITAFVACGFEHSIANAYLLAIGLLIKGCAPPEFWSVVGRTPGDFADLTWAGCLYNLLAVTAGNVLGGAGMVGAVYWFIYRRHLPAGASPAGGSETAASPTASTPPPR